MATPDKQTLRDLLRDNTLPEILTALQLENAEVVKEAESTKVVAVAPEIKQADLPALKTFLTDGAQAVGDMQQAYLAARTALLADKPDEFSQALMLFYKAARTAFGYLEA